MIPIETVLSSNKWGKVVLLKDDAAKVYLEPNQKHVPRLVPYTGKFKSGDIIKVGDYLDKILGINVAIVSRVRGYRSYRYGKNENQLELKGLPLQWFHESHFSL